MTSASHSPAAAADSGSFPATWRSGAVVFGVSAVMLALELVLPRFLIIRFRAEALNILLIIAITMLGLAYGGLIAFGLTSDAARRRAVSISLVALPVTILAGYVLMARVELVPLAVACVAPPFICAGLILAVFLIHAPSHSIYAANLAGSGAGACAGVALLAPVGGELLLCLIAAAGGVCALLWVRAGNPRFVTTGTAVAGIMAAPVAFTAAGAPGALDIIRLMHPPEAEADPYLFGTDALTHPDAELLATRWDHVARVDAIRTPGHNLAHKYMTDELLSRPPSPLRREYVEGLAGDVKLYFDNKFWTVMPAQDKVFAATGPYALLGRPRVLVIGVGGGVDIAKARYANARRIVGVEINQAVADLMAHELRAIDQGQYTAADIHVLDGRTYAHLADEQFDLIMLSFADLYVPLGKSDIFLENYLYTVEAIADYYDRLAPGGYLTVSKTLTTTYGHFELLRVVSTTLEYFHRAGVAHPERRIFVQGYPTRTKRTGGSVLVKKGEFTRAEVDALSDVIHPPFAVVHSPLTRIAGSPYADLLYTDDAHAFFENFPFDVTPITDDRPYFYLYDKDLTEHQSDFLTFLIVLGLTGVVPATVLFLREPSVRTQRMVPGLVFFACIAVAFMAVESVLIQKIGLYVGSPVISLAVVLTTILIAAGGGSYLSGSVSPSVRRGALVALPVVTVLTGVSLPAIFSWGAVPSLAGRAALMGATLVPLAVLMGMPFPSMLAHIRAHISLPAAALLFAINGALSALTVMLIMRLGPRTGLSVFLYAGACIYILAAVLYVVATRTPAEGPGSAA